MQAEHYRGNGFIIAPLNQSVPITKPPHAPRAKSRRLSHIHSSITGFFSECFGNIFSFTHIFTAKALSVTVALCCLTVFFKFFTFGTAIYYNGEKIAVASSESSYISALSSANAFAIKNNASISGLSFTITPAIALKSATVDEEKLRDKLLLCSFDFRRGCTVYSGDTPIFTATNLQTAKEVVNEYIATYSISDDADISTNLKFKQSVINANNVSDKDQCISLLSQSSAVSVVSVINTTSKKEIPFETQTEQDSNLYIGETVTVKEGKVGTATVQSEIIYENGTKQSSRVISENIVTQPVAQIVRVGIKPKKVLETGLFYPLEGVLSSDYGNRWGRMHEGIDIAVPVGTPVIAAECGTILFAGDAGSYGNLVKIDHGNGIVTAYAHLSTINVKAGQSVNADTQIALSGNTGRSTGPHLHFEIINNDEPVNPNLYLKKRS